MSDEEEWGETFNHEDKKSGSFIFNTRDCPAILMIKNNGDFYIKGKLVTNDMEIYEAFKEWVKAQKG